MGRLRTSYERVEETRSSRLVVIASEGRVTENIYFYALQAYLCSSNVKMVILERETEASSPYHVLQQLRDFVSKEKIEEDDQLWVVIDRDRWPVKAMASVARYCVQNPNLYFCVSNPCFELWLLLHLEDVTLYEAEQLRQLAANRKASKRGPTWLKQRMRDIMGSYQAADYDADSLMPHIYEAIQRAKALDVSPKDRWPQSVGTRVYNVVESIIGHP